MGAWEIGCPCGEGGPLGGGGIGCPCGGGGIGCPLGGGGGAG